MEKKTARVLEASETKQEHSLWASARMPDYAQGVNATS